MSSIAPMTHRPQPMPHDEPPVVSLQQRFADRVAEREGPVIRTRKKPERVGEEVVVPSVAVPTQPVRIREGDAVGPRREGVGGSDASATGRTDSQAPYEPARQPDTLPEHTPGAAPDRATAVPPVQVQPVEFEHPGETRTVDTPTFAPPPTIRTEVATAPATRAVESPHVQPRFPAPTPAPPTPASPSQAATLTVAFDTWGPGHEVRAHWQPGGGLLVPGSERIGLALTAAAQQPGAAQIAGDGWRVDHSDADADHRERPQRDAEQDA